MAEGKKIDFLPAFYARIPVGEMTLQAMDQALAAGYYRNGNEMCSNAARHMGKSWLPSVMLRLPLEGFGFKKRHRKLLRHNNARFQFDFRPFQPTLEMDTLWQRFKGEVHGWISTPLLERHLLRGVPATHYNLWQLTVLDGEKLVAFTAFDLGKGAMASLEAAYDPNYAKFSLGFYTMLLEIEFCLARGFRHYYPGFFPKDSPMFKYKLRPGEVEFLRLQTQQWMPIAELKKEDWLLDAVLEKLALLKQMLNKAGFQVISSYGHCLHIPSKRMSINGSNIHLLVPGTTGDDDEASYLFVTWDALANVYRAYEGEDMQPPLLQRTVSSHYFFHVYQKNYFGQFSQTEDLVLLAGEFGAYSQAEGTVSDEA